MAAIPRSIMGLNVFSNVCPGSFEGMVVVISPFGPNCMTGGPASAPICSRVTAPTRCACICVCCSGDMNVPACGASETPAGGAGIGVIPSCNPGCGGGVNDALVCCSGGATIEFGSNLYFF